MKIHHYAVMLGLVAALTACPQAPAPDTTAPTLVSSAPASGATGVAASASLSLHFSESMDKAALQLTATPPINLGAATWSDSSTVVCTPPGGWQLGTAYTLSVAGKDLAGNALTASAITFQTVAAADTTPPATPAGVKATAGDGAFTLEWNANTEADLSGYTVYWGASASALVNATFVPKPTTTLTIKDLENAKPYFYAVDAQDASDNHSVKSVAVSVTPADTTPPTLTSSEPSNGSVDIALVPTLSFSFSEPMNPASLEIGMCVTTDPPASATCAAPSLTAFPAPTWSASDTMAQFALPTGSFAGGKTYVLVLTAKDKAGNPLSSNTRVAFATRATPDTTPPTVDSTFGIDGAKASGFLSFVFSEAMNQVSVQNAFLSQPALTCAWAWSGNTATCTILSGLKQDTSYTLTMGAGAADTAGNKLNPYQTSFSTGNFYPRVTKFTPNPGAFGGYSAPNVPITLTFSEPMNTTTTGAAFSVKVGTKQIPGSTVISDSPSGTNTLMTFTPSVGYGSGATVSWSLTNSATDASGLPLSADVTGSFRTEPVAAP